MCVRERERERDQMRRKGRRQMLPGVYIRKGKKTKKSANQICEVYFIRYQFK